MIPGGNADGSFPITASSFTDTGLNPSTSYNYQIQAENSLTGIKGTWVNFNPASISPTKCVADFSTSDKIITADNTIPINYNSTCIGSGSGGIQTFKDGDIITFQLDVCNSGQIDANPVTVTDTLGTNLQTPTNFELNGNPISGTVNGNTITFGPFTIAKKPSNGSATIDRISFNAQIPVGNGNNQTLQTFSNSALIQFSTADYQLGDPTVGCVGTKSVSGCVIQTGNIVFINPNNTSSPTQKEIAP